MLYHFYGNVWSYNSTGATIWRVNIIVIDKALDHMEDIHDPALYPVSHSCVGHLLETKVIKASKPECHHLVLVGERELTVAPAIHSRSFLYMWHLLLVSTLFPSFPELLCQEVIMLLAHIGGIIILVALMVPAGLPLIV